MSILGLPASAFAMEAEALEALLARFQRPLSFEVEKAIVAKAPSRGQVRGRTALLNVTGPLLKNDSWFARALGATTYGGLRRRLQLALDARDIDAIAFLVDSPGGEVSGCDELAHAIFEARRKKPTAAYVSGMGASAAYWIASAAQKLVVSESAILGSIGVVQSYENRTVANERRGIRQIEFVSSQSPAKGYVPERIQKMVNDLADVFVAAVAKQRGIPQSKVLGWAGGVEIGQKAVAAGMADAVGSLDRMLADLDRMPVPIDTKPVSAMPRISAPQSHASIPNLPPVLSVAEQARLKAAVRAEQEAKRRIRAIFNSEPGQRVPDRASHYAYETKLSAADAIAAMKSESIAASWRAAAERLGELNGTF
ncbi:MAG: S49 family peptidase [Rhizobiaceae bacterium]|nr:S49 family peptidase [Rhizobiaceae bacterium]